MSHEEKALTYFGEEFHCSQAVFAAFAEELGITEEQALRVAHCFNGTIRKETVCGTCAGALMVIGMKYGQTDKDDSESEVKADEKAIEFLERFKKENGSYICDELLECDISTVDGIQYAKEHNCFTNVCPRMITSAVKILEDM